MISLMRRRMMMGGKKKRLPDGYTELQYIQCDGRQYLNTGVNVADTIEIEANFMFSASTPGVLYVVYSYSGTGTNRRYLELGCDVTSTTSIHWYFDTFSSIPTPQVRSTVVANTWYNTIHNASLVTINGNTTTYSGGGTSISYPIIIAADNSRGSISATYTGYIGDFIIRDNGLVVKHYVPAIDSNNKVGFYDLVNESFYESDSGTSFIAGPTI